MENGSSTATYCLTLKDNGDLWTGIGDMDIHLSVTPDRIRQCQKHIENASLVVLDGNFAQETIGMYIYVNNDQKNLHTYLLQYFYRECAISFPFAEIF